MTAKITGYAYETVPNKPILAGTAATAIAEVQAPENVNRKAGPSLGVLAVGADGLHLWRREEASAPQQQQFHNEIEVTTSLADGYID